jgi:hypothetical protein
MGAWGPGNFENDYALDYLEGHTRAAVEYLDGLLNDPSCGEADELADKIVAAAEVLAALCAALPARRPEVARVERWRDALLKAWDASIGGPGPSPEFVRERRREIEGAFGRLLGVARGAFRLTPGPPASP